MLFVEICTLLTVFLMIRRRGEVMSTIQLSKLLATGMDMRASDLHFSVDAKPLARRFGTLEPIVQDVLQDSDTHRMARELMSDEDWERFQKKGMRILLMSIRNGGGFDAVCSVKKSARALRCA